MSLTSLGLKRVFDAIIIFRLIVADKHNLSTTLHREHSDLIFVAGVLKVVESRMIRGLEDRTQFVNCSIVYLELCLGTVVACSKTKE